MMHETTSKTDSSLVLWGEIQENHTLSDDTNLWKPIKEYQNITYKHMRHIDKEIPCLSNAAIASEDSNSSSVASENEQMPCVDPVGSHIIELRKYYLYLEKHLQRRTRQKALEKSGRSKVRKVEKNEYFTIPPFPLKYPFSDSLQTTRNSQDACKMIVKFEGEIEKHEVEEKKNVFIRKVLEQIGFSGIDEDESVILKYLSAILDEFLQKFVLHLSRNKDSEDNDLWSPLETTLRSFGMGGISGLHAFYYENIAKKHDILLQKCMDKYDELMKL